MRPMTIAQKRLAALSSRSSSSLFAGPEKKAATLGAPAPTLSEEGHTGACLPGERADSTGRCYSIAVIEGQCVAEAVKTDQWPVPKCGNSTTGFTTKYWWQKVSSNPLDSYNDGECYVIPGTEEPHFDSGLMACTQAYFPSLNSGQGSISADTGKPIGQPIRRTWKPTVPSAATPTSIGACPPGQYRNSNGNCACVPGTVWSNKDGKCIKQVAKACPFGQQWDGKKCVKVGSFGSGGSGGLSRTV